MHGTERVKVCLSKAKYSETNSQKLTEAKVFADRKMFPNLSTCPSAACAIVAISAAILLRLSSPPEPNDEVCKHANPSGGGSRRCTDTLKSGTLKSCLRFASIQKVFFTQGFGDYPWYVNQADFEVRWGVGTGPMGKRWKTKKEREVCDVSSSFASSRDTGIEN